MMQLAFKSKMAGVRQTTAKYWQLFWAMVRYSLQADFAYFTNNFMGIFSVVAYTAIELLFVDAIFNNLNLLAGYNRNEVFLFLLVAQVHFSLLWVWSYNNAIELAQFINKGDLDFILSRPLNSMFFTTFRKFGFNAFFRDGIPGLIIIAFLVNWGELNLGIGDIALGSMMMILGQLAVNNLFHILVIPGFWFGESKSIVELSWAFHNNEIPFEAFSFSFKAVFTTLVPTLLTSAATASIILNKSDRAELFAVALSTVIIGSIIRVYLWNLGLKKYSSASS